MTDFLGSLFGGGSGNPFGGGGHGVYNPLMPTRSQGYTGLPYASAWNVIQRANLAAAGGSPYVPGSGSASDTLSKIMAKPQQTAQNSVTPNAEASALAHSAPYRGMIDQIAPQYAQQAGVDPNEFADTLQALIETENSAPDAESVAGAYGVSQAMPDWYNGLDRTNPQAQIIAGARALASKYQAVGPDSAKAAGAYFGYGTDANGMTTGQYVPIWQGHYNTVRHLPR